MESTKQMPRYPGELPLFIGGAWEPVGTRRTREVVNPATGAVIGQLPEARPADVTAALDAARAFRGWRDRPPEERGAVLRRAAALLRERVEPVATAATIEEGKTLAEMRAEVHMAAAILDWYAEEARRVYGRLLPRRGSGQRILVSREPVGPVAGFAPWNFPVVNPVRKVAAALAAGCSCVLKAAEEAPASALAVAHALEDAGLPPGVLSVLFGDPPEISRQLLASPVIRAVTFTGSITVGKRLASMATDTMKRTTMELGGHAPVVVLDDADVELASAHSVAAKSLNAGQVCVSPTRFYVQSGVYRSFVDAFVDRIKRIEVGDGMAEGTTMGPLAHSRRPDAVRALVDDAVRRGARLLAGGAAIDRPGYFWEPTVLVDVPREARVMNEEPFGPIAVLTEVSTVEEAIAEANRLPYGLAGYAFTDSARAARRLADELEVGMVGLNTFAISRPEAPFGGIKESGHGSEEGIEGLDGFLVTKSIHES
ncbi:NAD-dependent succinate-semialdehyde dehydrogenase [Micromonosporaceae bacterium B7E4]